MLWHAGRSAATERTLCDSRSNLLIRPCAFSFLRVAARARAGPPSHSPATTPLQNASMHWPASTQAPTPEMRRAPGWSVSSRQASFREPRPTLTRATRTPSVALPTRMGESSSERYRTGPPSKAHFIKIFLSRGPGRWRERAERSEASATPASVASRVLVAARLWVMARVGTPVQWVAAARARRWSCVPRPNLPRVPRPDRSAAQTTTAWLSPAAFSLPAHSSPAPSETSATTSVGGLTLPPPLPILLLASV